MTAPTAPKLVEPDACGAWPGGPAVACVVCTNGAVLAWQPGSSVAVVMPCPHCQGWRLVDLATWGQR